MHICSMCISTALNRSSVQQRFKRGNAIKICSGQFLPGTATYRIGAPIVGTPTYTHTSVHLGVRHSPKVTSSLNSLYHCQEIQHPLAAFSTPILSECGQVCVSYV